MNATDQFLPDMLADKRVDETEVPAIREYVFRDGQVNLEDVRLLVDSIAKPASGARSSTTSSSTSWEAAVLADGEIQPAEEFYLLKTLTPTAKSAHAKKSSCCTCGSGRSGPRPRSTVLCREALACPSTGWSTGGGDIAGSRSRAASRLSTTTADRSLQIADLTFSICSDQSAIPSQPAGPRGGRRRL